MTLHEQLLAELRRLTQEETALHVAAETAKAAHRRAEQDHFAVKNRVQLLSQYLFACGVDTAEVRAAQGEPIPF